MPKIWKRVGTKTINKQNMKKTLLKTTFATACVVAVSMGCFKAYTASNQSESSMLLAENVEALSYPDGDVDPRCIKTASQMGTRPCKESESTTITGQGGSVSGTVVGNRPVITGQGGSFSYTTSTTYSGKQEHRCESAGVWENIKDVFGRSDATCNLGNEIDCEGKYLNPDCRPKK